MKPLEKKFKNSSTNSQKVELMMLLIFLQFILLNVSYWYRLNPLLTYLPLIFFMAFIVTDVLYSLILGVLWGR